MIVVEKLSAGYGAAEVLHDVSITVPAGRLTTVIGANGAGKTTLLRTLSNIVRPRRGQISFAGAPTAGIAPHLLARRGLVHVPQGRQIVPGLSVRDNLMLGAERMAMSRADVATAVERELKRFPVLRDRQRVTGGNLSGGEQQMLAVSRALVMRPRLLMLDEPSLGLAPKIVTAILNTLRTLANDGLAILLVEQLAMLALEVADDAYILQRGRVVLSGPARDVRADPKMVERLLG